MADLCHPLNESTVHIPIYGIVNLYRLFFLENVKDDRELNASEFYKNSHRTPFRVQTA